MNRRASAGSICLMSVPSILIMPLLGSYKPSISLPSVVFPEPTGPMMPTFSPAETFKEMLFRTFIVWPGKEKVRFFNSMSPRNPVLCKNVLPAGLSTGSSIIALRVLRAALARWKRVARLTACAIGPIACRERMTKAIRPPIERLPFEII